MMKHTMLSIEYQDNCIYEIVTILWDMKSMTFEVR